jgi:hypothetical protein
MKSKCIAIGTYTKDFYMVISWRNRKTVFNNPEILHISIHPRNRFEFEGTTHLIKQKSVT